MRSKRFLCLWPSSGGTHRQAEPASTAASAFFYLKGDEWLGSVCASRGQVPDASDHGLRAPDMIYLCICEHWPNATKCCVQRIG